MDIVPEELSPIPCSGYYYVGTERTFKPKSLIHHLLRVRKATSIERGCAPFDVATTNDLIKLHYARPSNVDFLERLSGIVGFSKVNIQNDGTWWVSKISNFCSENGLLPNRPLKKIRTLPGWMLEPSDKRPTPAPANRPRSNTRDAALKMLKSNSLFKL